MIQTAEASVVPVRCTDVDMNAGTITGANGTGFVVGQMVVTASHVVSTCDFTAPGSISAGPYIVAVSDNDPTDDLAIMRSGDTGAPLALDPSTPAAGTSVELLGMPDDVSGASVEAVAGTVVATGRPITLNGDNGRQETLTDTIVVAANAIPGDSGGPVIDATGRVVGVVEGGGGGYVYLTPASKVVALTG